MRLEFFQLTSLGDREVNQDTMAHIVNNDYALFIVADGLGGHQAGEKASQFFCQGMLNCAKTYSKKIAQNPGEVLLAWINAAVSEMRVLFAGDPLADQAYTTCAILYLDEERAMAAHCGDSRIYRMTPQEILWRTRDHSIPQDLLNIGLITEEELAQHPEQNQLTRSINVNQLQRIDIKLSPAINSNETFVLCSDGFWEYVKGDEFLQLSDLESNRSNLSKLVRSSISRANGKSDNVTVLSVRCRKG
ncbi:PP2C family protein-serine/threonine phosphatase [Methyloglobulus sp.]|uniref:PP2C family protein-serine/threonine phosphatase n=1 Tax=Methyloglobulus sp. TaxID=2518622 RepID=UPI003989A5BD